MAETPFTNNGNNSLPQSNSIISIENLSLENNTETITANTTFSSATKSETIVGMIASIQLDNKGHPAWITTGHWRLQSDGPLMIGANSDIATRTQSNITNFAAVLYMVSKANGTAFHTHEISNFTQISVTHRDRNSITVNGTFNIIMAGGPVKNVPGYIEIMNNKIELWLDPISTHNHFGPTTITGIVSMTMM